MMCVYACVCVCVCVCVCAHIIYLSIFYFLLNSIF